MKVIALILIFAMSTFCDSTYTCENRLILTGNAWTGLKYNYNCKDKGRIGLFALKEELREKLKIYDDAWKYGRKGNVSSILNGIFGITGSVSLGVGLGMLLTGEEDVAIPFMVISSPLIVSWVITYPICIRNLKKSFKVYNSHIE